MTDFTRLTLRQNGRGLNAYLGSEFVNDSRLIDHPIGDDTACVAHALPNGGLLVLPIEALGPDTYPVRVPDPPPGLCQEFDELRDYATTSPASTPAEPTR
ncbi:hypothetical protein [Halomarina oriensis]|uniref:Uncharacterized protein n=1 Tax=Halomarina oriensis TaxID=671145 RepID=A0A6B0GMY7_9EURY|nr:hypothetical protein [Halomarina oriensis]MWG36232.1 hypothetical protein [Halomarina oriensis]